MNTGNEHIDAANIVQIYGSLFYLFFALFHLKQLIKHVFALLHCSTPINSQVTKCQIQGFTNINCIVRCLPINFMNSQIYAFNTVIQHALNYYKKNEIIRALPM